MPTGVAGSAGNAKITVSWTAPASSGSSTITSYKVTTSPGAGTADTAGTSLEITDLDNGTAYTFTVTATNALGTRSASSASSVVLRVLPRLLLERFLPILSPTPRHLSCLRTRLPV
ncbi:MAG TPA: hypothetical protein EYQ61_08435 [Dehalococcoidia bacterium]|nr:hypothetical protein [Dehalococcoidia bacterium]